MFASRTFFGTSRLPAQFGFTAIELMVVVSIVAILAALAAPSFTPLIERWRVRSATEEVQSTLYFARSEAIKRGGRVSIVRDSDGWAVYFDANNNGSNEVTEILQTTAPPPRLDITFPAATLTIDRWGMLTPIGTGFLVSPTGKPASDISAKRVCILGGLIKISKGDAPC
ncbi:MAG: GspH/FimT family pseudopilin [Acidovorax sp.]|nr:GspH/FimT family pseudopilin [Acidovorax sp.]